MDMAGHKFTQCEEPRGIVYGQSPGAVSHRRIGLCSPADRLCPVELEWIRIRPSGSRDGDRVNGGTLRGERAGAALAGGGVGGSCQRPHEQYSQHRRKNEYPHLHEGVIDRFPVLLKSRGWGALLRGGCSSSPWASHMPDRLGTGARWVILVREAAASIARRYGKNVPTSRWRHRAHHARSSRRI